MIKCRLCTHTKSQRGTIWHARDTDKLCGFTLVNAHYMQWHTYSLILFPHRLVYYQTMKKKNTSNSDDLVTVLSDNEEENTSNSDDLSYCLVPMLGI